MARNAAPIVLAIAVALVLAPCATPQVSPGITEYSGMCDASAAVAVGPTMFIVGNDEDNVLRVYRRDEPGEPVYTFDLTSFLKPDVGHLEADIEAATRVGDRVYWITSHGTSKNGKQRPSRHRLFATDVKVAGGKVTITPVGTPYENLVQDLAESPGLKDYNLGEAAKLPPEQMGGLNIEGLCATPEGSLLIAFRNPLPGGKALIVPLENANEVIDGKPAKLGKPILLSLDGLGFRSLDYFAARAKFMILAGPFDDAGHFSLYQWSGTSSAEPHLVGGVHFEAGMHPEALIVYPGEKTKAQFLCDDGTKQLDGSDCKLAPPEQRSFRSGWVTP